MSSLIEGRNAVIEALRGGVPLVQILLAEGVQTGGPIAEVERLAADRGVPVSRVARARLDSMSERGAHQGVVAEIESFEYVDLEEVLRAVDERTRSLVVVLDQVTDPGNLGAICRSAEIAGADAVIIGRHRAAPIGAAAHKSSAGALAHLPVVREHNIARVLRRLKDAGYWVAGADADGESVMWDVPLDDRLVLVVGAEGAGLSRLVKESCDFLVRIPVAGRVSSLNVAQAATLLAFEWVRRGRDAADPR